MPPSAEDDFILTISDNDDGPNVSDDEFGATSTATPGTKKRKRSEATQPSKSKKKQKNVATIETVPGVDESEEDDNAVQEEGWTANAEDDGALDSDFEFQVGENTGTIEDFDGWETSNTKKPNIATNGSTKTGVDIDDIIERRKAAAVKKAEKAKRKAERQKDDFEGLDGEEDGDTELGDDEVDVEDMLDADEDILADDAFGAGAVSDEDEEDQDEEDGAVERDEDGAESDEEDNGEEETDSDAESEAEPVAHPDDIASDASDSEDEREDPAEAERRAAFFAPESNLNDEKAPITKAGGSFTTMQLSRPILKGLAAVGFSEPTPIQAQTIPVALLGKDVVGGAETGSGKTGAFIIPILERLLYRPKKVPTTRVAILMPTRELAVQCFNVAKKLASFTDINFALIVGGFSLREQENVLKGRPDVVIATPGRFIDHMRNSPSFAVDTLEILVLDEADRMLEDGFADELNEILTTIPKSRQTMLFSATMTDSVDKLIRVGLNRPVRLMVNAKKQTVSGLVQEFVRLRPGREDRRLAALMFLVDQVYTDRTIVFFRQKKEAHRVRVVFSLCGKKAAELHGSMSQEQRIQSVESFRNGSASFLLATDLASRGLDIKGVSTVINYEAPQTHEIYLHRVGRTARAGRTGRACTIAAEPDRKVVKAAVRAARSQGAKVASRTVPSDEVDEWHSKIENMEEEIEAVLKEEREEKAMSIAERDIKKGQNIVTHEAEIMSRPKRSWFETTDQKKAAREAGRKELNPESALAKGEKKRKLSNKDKKKLQDRDDRAEGRMWKKGSDFRGKNISTPARDKKKEKERRQKAVEKKKKFERRSR